MLVCGLVIVVIEIEFIFVVSRLKLTILAESWNCGTVGTSMLLG